jgi:GAF domain-containing protein
MIAVPMLKNDALIGDIVIYRREVRPFTDKQIELVQNFAAQAVIAIENTRLLNELRQRTTDLAESLEQQTATSEVLRVISSSPGDLEPVFEAMLQNSVRICEAGFGQMFLREGDNVRLVAAIGVPPALVEFDKRRGAFQPSSGGGLDQVMRTKEVAHIADLALQHPSYPPAKLGGARSYIAVPMLREGELVGTIAIYRQEVRPFTDKQVALVQNFAGQAVIAIENARLLHELRQRTGDLTESLEQQTATSEVLGIISSSPGALEPVFQAILENGTRICAAKFGTLWLAEEDSLRAVAVHNPPPGFADLRRGSLMRPNPKTAVGRVLITKQVAQIVDLAADAAYLERDPARVALVEVAGARTLVVVPMLKDDVLMGAISIYRQEVQAFTDKQIALLQNFAAQAVIAIENTRLLNELRQRTSDLSESLEQQTATADVLRVISSSPTDIEPVLQAIVRTAGKLCDSEYAILYRLRDGKYHPACWNNTVAEWVNYLIDHPLSVDRNSLVGRTALERRTVHILDCLADPEYTMREAARIGNQRTMLGVPLLRDGAPIGVIGLLRTSVKPFTEKQIELVTTFADQAVIAIENTRLLNELRQRTSDLSESLEQQTATAEVLRVISSSPSELKPVFQSMLVNAMRICEAEFGHLLLYDGECFRAAYLHNLPPAYRKFWEQGPVRVSTKLALGRLPQTKEVIQITDMKADHAYGEGDPLRVATVDLGGAQTLLCVPMLKENQFVGAIVIYRQEVRPFTDKQVALVQNFAAQAVIAIENARLLNELREALQQQTATANVLKSISRSTFDLKSVLQTLVESAAKLCDAEMAITTRQINGVFYRAEFYGASQEVIDYVKDIPINADRSSVSGRALLEGKVVQIADVKADREYALVDLQKFGDFRTVLGVPMLREGVPIGVLSLVRSEVRPFTEKQIELVTNFADQAVIAIENARLLSELRQRTDDLTESLDQQTATADVLKIISRSTFDLRTVLQTLVESAARFCDADKATIVREEEGIFYTTETFGYSREFMNYIKNIPIKVERGSAAGRALVEGRVVHIGDVTTDPEYTLVEAQRLGDYRTALSVPMLREGVPIGALTLMRSQVQQFTDKQIELVATFADQASIAIENVRLFDEIQDKGRQLEEASQHKSQFLANMSHELRTPLNAILGYTELMADGAYGEPSEKMRSVLKRLEANGRHLLGLINDVLDLSKIEAGQLVLDLSDYSVQDIAQTVRSTLEPLAADKKLAFKLDMPAELPSGHGDGRRLTQVLINLVGNAIKFTDAGEVAIKAEADNGSFHVSVRDTGPGISAADQAKLFQEFQQADNAITKKKGGTGLGLAISKRIIEMHGGRIWIDSKLGEGSTFSFTVPVRVEP